MSAIKPGRNEACPCGSGNKYKRCCMVESEGIESTRMRVRQTEGRVVGMVLGWAHQHFGPELLESAWLDFLSEEDASQEYDNHPELEGAFVPWFLFDWIPDLEIECEDCGEPGAELESPLAMLFLEQREDELERRDVDFIREVCSRPFGFHQILEVDPGRSLTLRELLTGEECLVREVAASQIAQRGEILYARTITLEGVSLMFGCAREALPPRFAHPLLELRDALRKIHGRIGIEELHVLADPLRQTYWNHVDELRHPKLPTLTNTDGDPFEPTTLRFVLDATPEEALRALAPLAVGESLEDLLEQAERDAEGSIVRAELAWKTRGNRTHAHWENTVLGTLVIEPACIGADVNSEKRAKRLRKEIEKRLAGRVRFETLTTKSLAQLKAEHAHESAAAPEVEARRRAESEALEALPEVQAFLAKHREEHWRAWLDESIPALGGETPREAARSEQGRERLEALFLDFEWYARDGEKNPLAPDVAALRRELGL